MQILVRDMSILWDLRAQARSHSDDTMIKLSCCVSSSDTGSKVVGQEAGFGWAGGKLASSALKLVTFFRLSGSW